MRKIRRHDRGAEILAAIKEIGLNLFRFYHSKKRTADAVRFYAFFRWRKPSATNRITASHTKAKVTALAFVNSSP